MPIFEIEKDGKTYEVNARDEDTALAAIAGEDPSFASKAAHVAKGVGQAAVDVLDMPYNMNQLAEKATSFLPETMKTAGNKALEMTIPGLSGYRAVEQYLPDFARLEKPVSELPGLKQAKEKLASREFERGVSPGADALRIAAEWGTGGLPNAFRKGARVLPDVIAGAGAATGDYLSQLAGSDSPWGEIAGGVAAAIAGGRMPSKLKTDSKAVEFVEKNLDDPKAVQDAVEAGVARGEKGTTADLAADQGMFDIEQGVVTNDLATRKAFQAAEQDRAAQIAKDLQTPFAGDPAQAQVAAKDLTKRRAQVIKDQLKAEQANIASQAAETSQELAERGRIAQASDESAQAQAALMAQRAEEAGLPLATNKTKAQASREAQKTMSDMDAEFKAAEEQPKWQAFVDGPRIAVGDLYKNTKKFLKGMDEADRIALKSRYGHILRQPNAWRKKGDAAPRDVSSVFSRMRAAIDENRAQSASGFGDNVDRQMAQVMKDMQDSLATDMNPLYKEAKEATAELYDRFRSGKTGDARFAEPELYTRTAGGTSDEGGAVYARELENAGRGDPRPLAALAENLKADARRSGGVDADFILKNEDAINRLPPQQQQEFRQLAQANAANEVAQKGALEQTKRTMAEQKQVDREGKALSRAVEAQNKKAASQAKGLADTRAKNIVTKFGENPPGTVKNLLNDPSKLGDLSTLRRYMDNAGQGESFRAEIGNRLKRTLTPDSGGRVQEVTPKSIDKFNELRDQLVNSKVITPKEASEMSAVLNRTLTVEQRKNALSSTLSRAGSEMDNLIASGISAGLLTGMPGTQSLLMGGALRRMVKKMLVGMGGTVKTPAQIKTLEDIMMDPVKYLDLAKNAKTAEAAANAIVTRAMAASQTAAGINEEER